MKLFKVQMSKILLVCSLLLLTHSLQAAIVVITHADNKEIGLSKNKLAQIYLGKLKHYSHGGRIKAVDLPRDSKIYKKFYKIVVKKSNAALNRYWSKLRFTGKAKAPKKLATDREVLNWVANTRGAIGYVDGKYLNKSVNVVLIIP